MNFSIVQEKIKETVVVKISGYFSSEAGEDLAKRIEEWLKGGTVKFVFDFSACTSINSPGAASILDLVLRISDDFRGMVVITNLRALMHNLFEMVGIFPIAGSAENVEMALKELD